MTFGLENLLDPTRLHTAQWGRLKAEQEQEELQQCTFAPVVNEGGGSDARPPLHCRLEDLQRQRRSAQLVALQCSSLNVRCNRTVCPSLRHTKRRISLEATCRPARRGRVDTVCHARHMQPSL